MHVDALEAFALQAMVAEVLKNAGSVPDSTVLKNDPILGMGSDKFSKTKAFWEKYLRCKDCKKLNKKITDEGCEDCDELKKKDMSTPSKLIKDRLSLFKRKKTTPEPAALAAPAAPAALAAPVTQQLPPSAVKSKQERCKEICNTLDSYKRNKIECDTCYRNGDVDEETRNNIDIFAGQRGGKRKSRGSKKRSNKRKSSRKTKRSSRKTKRSSRKTRRSSRKTRRSSRKTRKSSRRYKK